MGRRRSAEEVEQEHLHACGPKLGPLYHALYNEVAWLHAKWLEYRKLYAKSKKRIDLLNATAGFFFLVVQRTMWDDVLMHIARLTDPPKQGEFENLTLLRLPETIADAGLSDEIRSLAATAQDRCKFARRWRNKRLAHLDLTLAVHRGASPLPGVSRQHVEDALASFRSIMNRLSTFYLQGQVLFDYFIADDDAEALVYNLAVALKVEERRQELACQGRQLPEDFEPSPDA